MWGLTEGRVGGSIPMTTFVPFPPHTDVHMQVALDVTTRVFGEGSRLTGQQALWI